MTWAPSLLVPSQHLWDAERILGDTESHVLLVIVPDSSRQAEEGNFAVWPIVLKFQEPIVTWWQDLSFHDFSWLMSLSPCQFSASESCPVSEAWFMEIWNFLVIAGALAASNRVQMWLASRVPTAGTWSNLEGTVVFEQTWGNLTSVLGLNLDHLHPLNKTAKERNESGPQQRRFHR